MTEPAIKVNNLSKRYRINTLRGKNTLWDQIRTLFTGWARDDSAFDEMDNLWALRGISFDVQPGEIVGVIGKNGSGKSTLLKLLSRIIRPTEGNITLRGRVASLLEVGTGFHPELSGRENIFLNAAILGMGREETRNKFDEIVEFSEVGRFIDTPVKRYSSGMRTRLAFAVAAHLEPDILLVDEVLSVGDINFQRKSLGKMNQVSREGRTVLFVSHNMATVASICERSILLQEGKIIADGDTADVVRQYMQVDEQEQGEQVWPDVEQAPGNHHTRLRALRIISQGEVVSNADLNQDIIIEIEYDKLVDGTKTIVLFHLKDHLGSSVLMSGNFQSANSTDDPWYNREQPAGRYKVRCVLPPRLLNQGNFSIEAILLEKFGRVVARSPQDVAFGIYDAGTSRTDYTGRWPGVMRPALPWHTEATEPTAEPNT